MKRYWKKNTTLIIAIVVAIGGVLLFIKTIVSPPQDLKFEDQYGKALDQKVDSLKMVDLNSLDNEYISCLDLADRLKKESKIGDSEFQNRISTINNIFAPKFAKYCFIQFKKNVWNENEFKWMNDRIEQLEENNIKNDSLTTISHIIENYNKAKDLSENRTYSKAEHLIETANKYKQDEYLRNNKALMNALNKLPGSLENAHYTYLRKRVDLLKKYSEYTYDEYNNLSAKINDEIRDFEDKKSIYRVYRDRSALKRDATKYYYEADKYYKGNAQ